MLQLPPSPADQADLPVKAWAEPVSIPTYEPAEPERLPLFLDRRVYQGSCGKVYPMPVIDRIAESPVDRNWRAIHLENRWIRLMILPELGGRIHVGLDRTNGRDFFYRQNVIKPALVGLAGPWCSGGVEFNWPQHHRPATFMPTDTSVSIDADGSATVWCADTDPLSRMRGMHGIRLRPDRAAVEVVVRLHNRTQDVQTFLWWANAAVRVHDRYQSIFPDDVAHVFDHAKRAVSTFPHASGHYYGVDYGDRKGRTDDGVQGNDLTWWRNIPVPTSYMAVDTRHDFFGGYDHEAQSGIIHVADRRIAPGKKQWTWGNHPFGEAWNRNLTDGDGPYIELMAGVFTDNQPDFSWLAPGETREFTQTWYPVGAMGAPRMANLAGAMSVQPAGPGKAAIGVQLLEASPGTTVVVEAGAGPIARFRIDLDPGQAFRQEISLPAGTAWTSLRVRAEDREGRAIIAWDGGDLGRSRRKEPPSAATEPPAPETIRSADELFLTGLHLEQYRHATRDPLPYWRELLRRDPGDSRGNLAVGRHHLRRGEWGAAERHLRTAIARSTLRNPNPADGEAHYQLGRCLLHAGRTTEAYDAFAKAAWNQAWQAESWRQCAVIALSGGELAEGRRLLEQAVARDPDLSGARNLLAMALKRMGRAEEADAQTREVRRRDPLDAWSAWLSDGTIPADPQSAIDLAIELGRSGFAQEALAVLDGTIPAIGSEPLRQYHRARLLEDLGRDPGPALQAAEAASSDRCFPARLEDLELLRWAQTRTPGSGKPSLYLGCWLYDRGRHQEALTAWRRATRIDPALGAAWRNLGIAAFNIARNPTLARRAYERAVAAMPDEARLRSERDQLWRRIGVSTRQRLRALEARPDLVAARDDLSIAFVDLLVDAGRTDEARSLLTNRRFQPWEGGEGMAADAHARVHLRLALKALAEGLPETSIPLIQTALDGDDRLGESRHAQACTSRLDYWLGEAHRRLGHEREATAWFERAAAEPGDFTGMQVRPYGDQSIFAVLALRRLGRRMEAERLLGNLRRHAGSLLADDGRIDYFATSLPTMLLFHDDLALRRSDGGRLLLAQCDWAARRRSSAGKGLAALLRRDPGNAAALDLTHLMHLGLEIP